MTVEDMLTETIICGSNEVNSVNGGDTGIGYGGGGDSHPKRPSVRIRTAGRCCILRSQGLIDLVMAK